MISIAWRMSVESIFIMNWYFFSNGVQKFNSIREMCVPDGSPKNHHVLCDIMASPLIPKESKATVLLGPACCGKSVLLQAMQAACQGPWGLKMSLNLYLGSTPPLPTAGSQWPNQGLGWLVIPEMSWWKSDWNPGGAFWFRFLDVWFWLHSTPSSTHFCQVTQAAEMRPKSKLPSVENLEATCKLFGCFQK